jgi:hypothetical protein
VFDFRFILCSTPFGIWLKNINRQYLNNNPLCLLNAFRHLVKKHEPHFNHTKSSVACSTPFGIWLKNISAALLSPAAQRLSAFG